MNIKLMPEKEQIAELKKIEATRDFANYGRDGLLQLGRKKFIYKGINYEIAIIRYYTLKPIAFKRMGSERITDCHAVVEYPKETESLRNLIHKLDEYSEFLYHDTLHRRNDKQTIEEQIEICHRMAKADINSIPKIIKEAETKLLNLKNAVRVLLNRKKKL